MMMMMMMMNFTAETENSPLYDWQHDGTCTFQTTQPWAMASQRKTVVIASEVGGISRSTIFYDVTNHNYHRLSALFSLATSCKQIAYPPVARARLSV